MKAFDNYFTEQEEKTLFNGVKQVDDIYAKRDYYWMLLIRETGIRLSVAFGPDEGKKLKQKLSGIGLTLGNAKDSIESKNLVYDANTNKRNNDTPIFLSTSAVTALQELIKIHNKLSQSWTNQGFSWDLPADERPLILSRQRSALSRRTAQSRMEKWCKQFKIDGTIHDLRHTWAKRYLKRSTNPAAALVHVQAVLGHKNLTTTSIYVQPSKEDIAQAMREASSCRR